MVPPLIKRMATPRTLKRVRANGAPASWISIIGSRMCFKTAWAQGRTVKSRNCAAPEKRNEHFTEGDTIMGTKMGSQPKAVKPSAAIEDRDTSALMLDLMLEALRVQNDRLNAIAIELFGR